MNLKQWFVFVVAVVPLSARCATSSSDKNSENQNFGDISDVSDDSTSEDLFKDGAVTHPPAPEGEESSANPVDPEVKPAGEDFFEDAATGGQPPTFDEGDDVPLKPLK